MDKYASEEKYRTKYGHAADDSSAEESEVESSDAAPSDDEGPDIEL